MKIKLSLPFLGGKKEEKSVEFRVEELDELLSELSKSNRNLSECLRLTKRYTSELSDSLRKLKDELTKASSELNVSFLTSQRKKLEKITPPNEVSMSSLNDFYFKLFNFVDSFAKAPTSVQQKVLSTQSGVSLTKELERISKKLYEVKKFLAKRFTDEKCDPVKDYEQIKKKVSEIRSVKLRIKTIEDELLKLREEKKKVELKYAELKEKIEAVETDELASLAQELKEIQMERQELFNRVKARLASVARDVQKTIHGVKSLETFWKKFVDKPFDVDEKELEDFISFLKSSKNEKLKDFISWLEGFMEVVERDKKLSAEVEFLKEKMKKVKEELVKEFGSLEFEVEELKRKLKGLDREIEEKEKVLSSERRNLKKKILMVERLASRVAGKKVKIVE